MTNMYRNLFEKPPLQVHIYSLKCRNIWHVILCFLASMENFQKKTISSLNFQDSTLHYASQGKQDEQAADTGFLRLTM